MRTSVLFFGILGLMLSGCELRLGMDVAVDGDGSGALTLEVALDPELADLLDGAGADLFADLDGLRAAVPGWDITEEPAADGVRLTLATTFDGPADFAAVTDDLHAALGPDDGRIFRDLRLVVADDRVTFSGEIGLVPPRVPGATGPGIAFDADDLARLVTERGDEFVRYDVRVTLPGPPTDHDADEVTGRTLTWAAPIGELRQVRAEAPVASDVGVWVVVATTVLAVMIGALIVVAVRSRSARRGRVN